MVKISGKWGYIDKTGKLSIKPQFDTANSYHNGLALVGIGDKSSYIDLYNINPTLA